MTEMMQAGSSAGASQGAPNSDVSPFTGTIAPDVTGWTSTQALTELDAWKATIAADAKHPIFDNAHPQHAAAVKHWGRLHEVAYSAAGNAVEEVAEPPVTEHAAHTLVNNEISWPSVRMDGQRLSSEDETAARGLLASAVGALALPRADAGRLVFALSGALHSGAAGQTYESAQSDLVKELGSAGAETTIRNANAVLRHLDSLGLNVSEALRRAGAANSPVLVRELARLAPRLSARKS